MFDNVEFIEGLPNDFFSLAIPNAHVLIIIDDLQQEALNSKQVETLFTRDAHHKNMSVCLLTQNLFYQGKFARTIALNAHVIILFKNPRFGSQLKLLENQLGVKHIYQAYLDVMKQPYNYLVIDLGPKSDPIYQMRSSIFPGEEPIIYS